MLIQRGVSNDRCLYHRDSADVVIRFVAAEEWERFLPCRNKRASSCLTYMRIILLEKVLPLSENGVDPLSKQERNSMKLSKRLARLQSTAVEKVLLRNGVDRLNLCWRRWQTQRRSPSKSCKRKTLYNKTSSDDRRSVSGSLFLSPLCRMQNECSPERRREIWLCSTPRCEDKGNLPLAYSTATRWS